MRWIPLGFSFFSLCVSVLVLFYTAVPQSPISRRIVYHLSSWETTERSVTLYYLGFAPVTTCFRSGLLPSVTDEELKSMCLYYKLGIDTSKRS